MNDKRRVYRRLHRRRNGRGIRGIFNILLTLFLFFGLGAIILSLPANRKPTETLTGAAYVIDGDTVVLGRIHIRLLGIDAPEMGQFCQKAGREYACGREARAMLRNKIGRRAIRCKKEGLDKYRRDLARCYLAETDLNLWMVEQGWAVSYGDYRSEEALARREQRGLWAGQFETPSQWRKEHQKSDEEMETGHGASPSGAISELIHYIRKRIIALIYS
ncbi:thermonuclease family protein [Falsochrobactrum sp. TDYN1]|uniref:Thermonuclease family protein n=1 Tax=Falsochrobactrum tianjinense TaxID=2706015 RepID=A0A949UU98_9HYPH|nr:thermonuclease family protein [Falsochrobactrum sp. TDYN1]MBV2142873.1 thermonuclease family protein [Falsochrobactrum sp. TDYN1]